MIKAIMGALLLVIVACVFGAVIETREQQKRFELRSQRQQDTRAKLVECTVNSLSSKAKDQIAHEQVDSEAPTRLTKFQWYGGLPFVDSAWRRCNNQKIADQFENGIEREQLIMQHLKNDSEYQALVTKWKKVQATEVTEHDEETRQIETAHGD